MWLKSAQITPIAFLLLSLQLNRRKISSEKGCAEGLAILRKVNDEE